MENQFCHSCGIPLFGEAAEKARGNYCQHCSTETGELKPWSEMVEGTAMWLKSWGGDDSVDYKKRAASYLKAMPAWAE